MQYNRNKIILLASLEFIFIIALYYTPLGLMLQWSLALFSLIAVGIAIKKIGKFDGWYFVYLVGSKRGLYTMDRFAKKHTLFWQNLAEWGIILSLGLFSLFLFRKRLSARIYVIGMLSLIIILFFILPFLSYALPFIELPQLQNAMASTASSSSSYYLSLFGTFISIITGFAGYLLFSLFYNTAAILWGIAAYLLTITAGNPNHALLTSQMPGVAPIIPGIDIPLVAGIASLALLLIVHEASHGVLARVAKVKLKSTGLLLFGVIPIGAFVEPDEKIVEKADKMKQTRIFAAGISANFLFMLIFFLLMLPLLLFVVPGLIQVQGVYISSTMNGYPAYNVLKPGMQILYWDGQPVNNLTNLESIASNDKPGSVVSVTTNTGLYNFIAVASNGSSRGYIGVTVSEKTAIAQTPYSTIMYFLYTLFALSFMLNFLVGVINLLPLPGFDGWRLYAINTKKKFLLDIMASAVIFALLVNLFQWVFFI
ncbi:MAG: site-2 protease family protein [Candidatus Micrarchaeaceae archaeon]